MNNIEVVTLATFSSASEANIMASMLLSMGINVQVVNEISSDVVPYVSGNVVKILVSNADYELAKEIIGAKIEKPEKKASSAIHNKQSLE